MRNMKAERRSRKEMQDSYVKSLLHSTDNDLKGDPNKNSFSIINVSIFT